MSYDCTFDPCIHTPEQHELFEKWNAKEQAFKDKFNPMLAEIRAVMKKYGVDETKFEDCFLGLDHLGESCPPN